MLRGFYHLYMGSVSDLSFLQVPIRSTRRIPVSVIPSVFDYESARGPAV